VKVGLIARAEDRGLGIQSWEFYRAMRPERTLLVDMGQLARGFPAHRDRYPDATLAHFDGGRLPEATVRDWLRGLDVVFTAETFYDWRLPRWAAEHGVATVCQLNPEFHAAGVASGVTRWWAPTCWRFEHLPPGTRVVPVPVAGDRFPLERPPRDGPLRLLHVVGHRALADRNGTVPTTEALRRVRGPVTATLATQDARLAANRLNRRGVTVGVRLNGVRNYWDVYRGQDVLILPRRYGGLCLPVQEAMASGLAVVMTDTEPQASTWPATLVRSRPGRPLHVPAGDIRPVDVDAVSLARAIDELVGDDAAVVEQQEASLRWARANTWEALRPLYERELADACR